MDIQELGNLILSSILLTISEKQELLNFINQCNNPEQLNDLKEKLNKEKEFIIKYLKHIVKDDKDTDVLEIKSRMSKIYINFVRKKEKEEREEELIYF